MSLKIFVSLIFFFFPLYVSHGEQFIQESPSCSKTENILSVRVTPLAQGTHPKWLQWTPSDKKSFLLGEKVLMEAGFALETMNNFYFQKVNRIRQKKVSEGFLLIMAWDPRSSLSLKELSHFESLISRWRKENDKDTIVTKHYLYSTLFYPLVKCKLFHLNGPSLFFLSINIRNRAVPRSFSFDLYQSSDFALWMEKEGYLKPQALKKPVPPSFFLVNPRGKVVYHSSGSPQWKEIYYCWEQSRSYFQESPS